MGQPLDDTRETRFPPSRSNSERSQQTNLRELEEAIYYLQDQRETLQATIEAQAKLIDTLMARIDILESQTE